MHIQVEHRRQLPRDVEVAGEVGGGFEAPPGEVGGGAVEVDGEVGGGVDVASRNHLAVIQRLSIKYSSIIIYMKWWWYSEKSNRDLCGIKVVIYISKYVHLNMFTILITLNEHYNHTDY